MTRDELRKKAESLRTEGKSYGDISRELGVAKSTLSYWFNTTSCYLGTSEKQLKHLVKARVLARKAISKKQILKASLLQEKVSLDFKKESLKDIFTKKIALSMLYWAEGTKHKKVGGLTFTNTDPMLIKVFVSLLYQTFNIDLSKIKLRLAIHYYHNEEKCKIFWSNLIGIEVSQFTKTYLKPRGLTKKFRQNFMGICFVYYPNGDIRKEILEIGSQYCNQISLS